MYALEFFDKRRRILLLLIAFLIPQLNKPFVTDEIILKSRTP